MLLLVTGATGKVGTNLIAHILAEPRWKDAKIRALCHNRLFPRNRQGRSCQRRYLRPRKR